MYNDTSIATIEAQLAMYNLILAWRKPVVSPKNMTELTDEELSREFFILKDDTNDKEIYDCMVELHTRWHATRRHTNAIKAQKWDALKELLK